MIYDTLTLWTANSETWHALRNSRGRDLSMSVLRPWEVEKIVAFANMHNMTIIDQR